MAPSHHQDEKMSHSDDDSDHRVVRQEQISESVDNNDAVRGGQAQAMAASKAYECQVESEVVDPTPVKRSRIADELVNSKSQPEDSLKA